MANSKSLPDTSEECRRKCAEEKEKEAVKATETKTPAANASATGTPAHPENPQGGQAQTSKSFLFTENDSSRAALQKKLTVFLILLFLFVISPVFFQLNSQGCPTLRIPFSKQVTALVDYAKRHFLGSNGKAEQNKTPSVEKIIKASLKEDKIPLNSSFELKWYKDNQSFSFKYVNVTMCIVAYLLGIILLSIICYRIYKTLQRDKIIRDNNDTFRDFFNQLSPKHPEYKELFVREIMHTYFNKKGE